MNKEKKPRLSKKTKRKQMKFSPKYFPAPATKTRPTLPRAMSKLKYATIIYIMANCQERQYEKHRHQNNQNSMSPAIITERPKKTQNHQHTAKDTN